LTFLKNRIYTRIAFTKSKSKAHGIGKPVPHISINDCKENYVDKNSILDALKSNQDQSAMDEQIGMVVVNEELLQQVSGGAWYGRYLSLSAECMGFNCSTRIW